MLIHPLTLEFPRMPSNILASSPNIWLPDNITGWDHCTSDNEAAFQNQEGSAEGTYDEVVVLVHVEIILPKVAIGDNSGVVTYFGMKKGTANVSGGWHYCYHCEIMQMWGGCGIVGGTMG